MYGDEITVTCHIEKNSSFMDYLQRMLASGVCADLVEVIPNQLFTGQVEEMSLTTPEYGFGSTVKLDYTITLVGKTEDD